MKASYIAAEMKNVGQLTQFVFTLQLSDYVKALLQKREAEIQTGHCRSETDN